MKSALEEIKNAALFEDAAEHILANADEYNVAELILPAKEKEIFQECAYILCRMPTDFVAKHAVEMLEWFQDLNWPGVNEIFTAMCQLPMNILTMAVRKALETAYADQDDEWIYNLHLKFDCYIQ